MKSEMTDFDGSLVLHVTRRGPHGRGLVVKIRREGEGALLSVQEGTPRSVANARARRHVLPCAWFDSLVDELRSLEIPALPKLDMRGLDETYELHVFDAKEETVAAYRWWTIPHGGWDALDLLARRIVCLCDCLGRTENGAERVAYVTTCAVVGMGYVPDIDDLLPYLTEGARVRLVRERDNSHDARAVAVHLHPATARGMSDRVGYVPRKCNAPLAELLDAGVALEGVVTDVADDGNLCMTIHVFKMEVANER